MPRTKKQIHYYACDFETTVWGEELEKERGKQQDYTEVWAGAFVELYDEEEKVEIKNSIRDFLEAFYKMEYDPVLYFHNLSFDGSFIVDFLLREGYIFTNERAKDMKSNTFNVCISQMGSWYFMRIKKGHRLITIRDSLKLMPSSLSRIAQAFKTKHKKLTMEYEGDRKAYCEIPEKDKEYIKNDVLVLKEALEKMFNEGHNKLTIGSCCLEEFKKTYDKIDYKNLFPDLTDEPVDERYFSCWNAWEFTHKSYGGGWCYVNSKYAKTVVKKGQVYDVNSLYPSMMHSVSGNRYPIGKPTFFIGKPTQKILENEEIYYFLMIRCRFELKENCLPWVHIRKNPMYRGNDNLSTSDVVLGSHKSRYYVDIDGNIKDTKVEMVLTMTDWILLQDTYNLYDLEIIGGCWFWSRIGIFDEYIDKYKKIKTTTHGFSRELAKLFLNNLYGKLAMGDDSSYKQPYLDENGEVKFLLREEHEKKVGYIPAGSAITSYARNFTIRSAMANIDIFCYADTDSIHLATQETPKEIIEHDKNFCCWKQENMYSEAYYCRQKVYAERVTHENHKKVEEYLDIKCSGMNKEAKEKFIEMGYDISDLEEGLSLPECNLKATRIRGGILLKKSPFNLRKKVDKAKKLWYNEEVINQ